MSHPSSSNKENNQRNRSNPVVTAQVLHVGRQIPISVTLQNIIEKSFPEELAERRAEMKASDEPAASDRPESPVPLFVMCCLMPGGHLLA